jgi:SsrA-binding protein
MAVVDRTQNKTLASNRRARHEYAILDEVEAGIVLRGSEVKSLRLGLVQIADAYARVVNDEVWLDGLHIAPYSHAQGFGAHIPDRGRKLLLHRREIERLGDRVSREHLTLVPLSLYLKEGRVKVQLALAKGRTRSDKRQAIAERDSQMEIKKAIGRNLKGRDF